MSNKDSASPERPAPPPRPAESPQDLSQSFYDKAAAATAQAEQMVAAQEDATNNELIKAVTPGRSSLKEAGATTVIIGSQKVTVTNATAQLLMAQVANDTNNDTSQKNLNRIFTSALNVKRNQEKQNQPSDEPPDEPKEPPMTTKPTDEQESENQESKEDENSTTNQSETSDENSKLQDMEEDTETDQKKASAKSTDSTSNNNYDSDDNSDDENEDNKEDNDNEDEENRLTEEHILQIEETATAVIDPDKILKECLAPLRDAKGTSQQCHGRLKKIAEDLKTAKKAIQHAESVLEMFERPDFVPKSIKLGVELSTKPEWLKDDEITQQNAERLERLVTKFQEFATKILKDQKAHEISLLCTKRNKTLVSNLYDLATAEAAGKLIEVQLENPMTPSPTMSNTEIAATAILATVTPTDEDLSMYDKLNETLGQHPKALTLKKIIKNLDGYERVKIQAMNQTDHEACIALTHVLRSYIKCTVIDYYDNLKTQEKQKAIAKAIATAAQATAEKRIADQVTEAIRLAQEAQAEREAAGDKAAAEQIKNEKTMQRKLIKLQTKVKKLEAKKRGGRTKPPTSKPKSTNDKGDSKTTGTTNGKQENAGGKGQQGKGQQKPKGILKNAPKPPKVTFQPDKKKNKNKRKRREAKSKRSKLKTTQAHQKGTKSKQKINIDIKTYRAAIMKQCGFIPDTTKTFQENIESAKAAVPYDGIANLACHDLISKNSRASISNHQKKLLGLGLNFCVTRNKKANKKATEYIDRFRRDIRLRIQFKDDNKTKSTDKRLYVPNPYWQPDKAAPKIESAIDRFKHSLEQKASSKQTSTKPNLRLTDTEALAELRDSDDLIVLPTDKNLGPAVVDKETYVRQCLTEHLLNTKNYERLTAKEAKRRMYNARARLIKMTLKEKKLPADSDDERYFKRSLFLPNTPDGIRTTDRTPQFYGAPKVHKHPWKLRPVVSAVGSTMEIMSKWLDNQLQRVVRLCPSYLQDSWQLLDELKRLGRLPPGSKLVTADAVAMYCNIDTDHGLEVIRLWLEKHKSDKDFPENFPTDMVCEGLELVMRNNIFQFDDCYFHQKEGAAMGTSTACAYATTCYSYHEENFLPIMATELKLYRRLIDDGFFVITPSGTATADEMHGRMKKIMNSFGYPGRRLEWTTDKPSNSVDFLDLTITTGSDGRIRTKTFQKPMNLHLCVPPTSAHSPKMFQGMIFGQIRRFFLQNSSTEDFQQVVQAFYEHLYKRGYSTDFLVRTFNEAATKLDNKSTREPTADTNQVFFHQVYHPGGNTRPDVHKAFRDSGCQAMLQQTLNVDKITIALHRLPNLRNLVNRTRLTLPEGRRASSFVESLEKNG